MHWLNAPPAWREDDGTLFVTTGEQTDFWRVTHYGFVRDDGHFRHQDANGDFSAEVAFAGDWRELYDQAGLMIRLDGRNWLKAGIEFVGGRRMLSAVATRDFSDWSTMPFEGDDEWLRLRLTRQGTAVRVEWATGDGTPWQLLRLAYLPQAETALVGPMCCSPQRAGFEARFRDFRITGPTGDTLHA